MAAPVDIDINMQDVEEENKSMEDDDEDSGFWVDYIEWDEENEDAIIERLAKLKMMVANTLAYKDYNQDHEWKSVTLEPVTLADVSARNIAEAAKLCIAVNFNFAPSTTQSGARAVTGTAEMFFNKRADLVRCVPSLKSLRAGIEVKYVEELETIAPPDKKTNSKDFFKMKAALIEHRFEVRHDDRTLFTSSISDTMVEDSLWRLFPGASHIILSHIPYGHAYIQFDSNVKLDQTLEFLKLQSPPSDFPRLKLVMLSHARKAFGMHRRKDVDDRKKAKEFAQAQRAQGQQQRIAAQNGTQQLRVQPGGVQMTALGPTATQEAQLASALGQVAGLAADNQGQALSKGQLRRRKMQRKKAAAAAANQLGVQMPAQTMVPSLQDPGLGSGLNLVLQTLGTLAQTMGQQIGQQGGPLLGQAGLLMGQQPIAQQPLGQQPLGQQPLGQQPQQPGQSASAKRRAKKRRKNSGGNATTPSESQLNNDIC